MSTSQDAQVILDVTNDSGPRTRLRSAFVAHTAPETESELLEAPPYPAPTHQSLTTGKRLAHFEDDPEEGPSIRPTRSTRGVAPVRLDNADAPAKSTPCKVNNKRKTSTQQQQPSAIALEKK